MFAQFLIGLNFQIDYLSIDLIDKSIPVSIFSTKFRIAYTKRKMSYSSKFESILSFKLSK